MVSDFSPAWWLPSSHLQTIFPAVCRRAPKIAFRRERLELPDGDFLDLMWGPAGRNPGASGPVTCGLADSGPADSGLVGNGLVGNGLASGGSAPTGSAGGDLVVICHGLAGNESSGFIRGLVAELSRRGIGSVVMIARGASPEPNRHRRSYHAAAWDDLDTVIETLQRRYPHQRLAACGFSLSGSILLNWLGERQDAPLHHAVAVSVPFELAPCATALESGIGWIYQEHLLRKLRPLAIRKFAACPETGPEAAPVSCKRIAKIRSLREFDDLITAPINGFADSADYYRRASCRQRLAGITQPTTILHALDDPLVPESAIPSHNELGPGITLELTPNGGHTGFVCGSLPGHHRYWLDRRIADAVS
ncbi:alpha/beta hydrolase [Halorhodospira abdelmalekii]|uniref:YheT family hydrolase n=1 Tax=Halorhodospira abdelmalekii TaxID=421629 RepID=UPI001903C3B2|nr:alpha/beta fold hydrolase [Halorhodospira abdelmalekii]MBK1735485.1 alpha/beta hydrolase [Halorhodospira abdelmalekii]